MSCMKAVVVNPAKTSRTRSTPEREILDRKRSRGHHAPTRVNLLEGWRYRYGLSNV